MYNMEKDKRRDMGLAGQKYVNERYNFSKYINSWRTLLKEVHEKNGSWETRKGYKSWDLLEV